MLLLPLSNGCSDFLVVGLFAFGARDASTSRICGGREIIGGERGVGGEAVYG
jgi:hypothetical protein